MLRKQDKAGRELAAVVRFDNCFDGTDMAIGEISDEARARGWAGLRIDSRDLMTTGRIMVYRLTRQRVTGVRRG